MNQNDEAEQVRAQALALQSIRDDIRKGRPLWAQLRVAMDKAKLLSTVGSGGISEYTTRGKTEGKAPPRQQETALEDHLALVEHAVELYVSAVDAESGLGAGKVFALMDREEKDKELLKWRGVKSWVVAARAPWLGDTPRTIERARDRLMVRPSNGLPLEGEQKRRRMEREAA